MSTQNKSENTLKFEVFEDGGFDFQIDKAFSNYERLDGIYTPVRIYEALLYFVNNAHMDIVHGDQVINLLDFFPMLKKGYCQRNMLITLMFSYCKINGLIVENFYKPDELINKAFNSDIPAHFMPGRKLMTEAVNEGIVDHPLNTFDVIKLNKSDFNHELFRNYYFQTINSLNFDVKDPELIEFVKDKDFTDKLINESKLFNELSKTIKSASNNRSKDCKYKPLKIDLTEMLNIIVSNKLNV